MFFNKIFSILIFNSFFYSYVNAHSWVACTNYKINNIPINYDLKQCIGFPRDYESQYQSDLNRGFAFDTGSEFRSQSCKSTRNPNYSLQIANYIPGQEVCIIYPSKNHVSEYCTNNLYIPDNGLFISRSTRPNTDVFDKEYVHKNGKHTFGTVDYKGFQNCPGFCGNQDKTPCYVCFTLENNIPDGIYSFKWTWEFNSGEYYTNCWDALITNSPVNTIQPTNQPTIQPTIQPTNQLTNQPTNQPINNNEFSNSDLINNNPFKSMEEQCRSDDNICKDYVNKRRDAFNKLLDRKNNKYNAQSVNQPIITNYSVTNPIVTNKPVTNTPNLRIENPIFNLKYEYIENNICKN
jgi:hypothetical protein